ncbi:MAG: hypothetical protein JO362_22175 [Streptomycetaceae bacterium]|nr:hypothetical protein [Kutzneria sp.]MBV9026434.1 hypothetical protein [Streptomycetaceae bacterium]
MRVVGYSAGRLAFAVFHMVAGVTGYAAVFSSRSCSASAWSSSVAQGPNGPAWAHRSQLGG